MEVLAFATWVVGWCRSGHHGPQDAAQPDVALAAGVWRMLAPALMIGRLGLSGSDRLRHLVISTDLGRHFASDGARAGSGAKVVDGVILSTRQRAVSGRGVPASRPARQAGELPAAGPARPDETRCRSACARSCPTGGSATWNVRLSEAELAALGKGRLHWPNWTACGHMVPWSGCPRCCLHLHYDVRE